MTSVVYQLWQPFNLVYGPWYRAEFKVGSQTVTAVVQPDMEPGRYFWSVRFPAYNPKPYSGDPNTPHLKKTPLPEAKIGGAAPDLATAKKRAEEAARTGRPPLT